MCMLKFLVTTYCLLIEKTMLQASGEIVYFCNGRAVSADHSGASKIIHAHRNCTEWFVIVCNSFFYRSFTLKEKLLSTSISR